jgi:hypothetical protein
MNHACWLALGASNSTCSTGTAATTASTTSGRTRPDWSKVPTSPLWRPSVTASAAPASRSEMISNGQLRAANCSPGALDPTSASTVKSRAASLINARFCSSVIDTVPRDTST